MLKFNKGQRFGRLTIYSPNFVLKGRRTLWKCLCDCGKLTQVSGYSLKAGLTKSCGCLKRELSSATMKITAEKYNAQKKISREEELLRTLLSELEE